MDITKFKELLEKVLAGTATEEEKVETIKDLNLFVKEYNRLMKEALAQNQS